VGCWAVLTQREAEAFERDRRDRDAKRWKERALHWRRVAEGLLPGWPGFFFEGSLGDLALAASWSLGAGGLALYLLYPAPAVPWTAGSRPLGSLALLTAAYALAFRRSAVSARGARRR
jgi:hypothetical protein